MNDLARAQALARLAGRAMGVGLHGLTDNEVLHLLAEQRWAVARLSQSDLPLAARSALNGAVLRAHTLLHKRDRRGRASLGDGVRAVGHGFLIALGLFVACAAVAGALVGADPVLAFTVVPREFLAQIDETAWGARSGDAADLGMTFFYWGNNLRASFMALGLGALGGVPSMLVIVVNGALFGAVGAMATVRGVGPRFWGWLGPHGVPELAALMLCAAIGLRLGLSLLAPGWHTRRAAVAEAGRTLTPMVVVAACLVICAAPLEGFVAPLDLPMWADLGIAGGWVLLLGGGAFLATRRQAT